MEKNLGDVCIVYLSRNRKELTQVVKGKKSILRQIWGITPVNRRLDKSPVIQYQTEMSLPTTSFDNTFNSADRKSREACRGHYIVGICAMEKKAKSKAMQQILHRLLAFKEFSLVFFGNRTILEKSIEEWPICDILIGFYSTGFPLRKAIQYVDLRQPVCINDLQWQQLLLDRRLVLKVLDEIGVDTPKRVIVNRDTGSFIPSFVSQRFPNLHKRLSEKDRPSIHIEQTGDCLRVDGQVISKPFVEKPVSGENHNIHIYYDQAMGGGGRRLFRKIDNRSSEYCPDLNHIRTEGSYIYEQFMAVEHSKDVKVYTIGPHYAYAESRKSPVVDGIVQRNVSGREVREVIQLTEKEMDIAKKICIAFGQMVCGFDLLRVNGRSYVCDVNGWSFVKGNSQYYDACAYSLREMMLHGVAEKRGLFRIWRSPTDFAGIDKAYKYGDYALPVDTKGGSSSHRSSFQCDDRESFDTYDDASGIRDNGNREEPKEFELYLEALAINRDESAEEDQGQESHQSCWDSSKWEPSILHVAHHHWSPNRTFPIHQEPSYSDSSLLHEEPLHSQTPCCHHRPFVVLKLKGFLGVFRHADRTPKQKLKVNVTDPLLCKLFDKRKPSELIIKTKANLKDFAQVVERVLTQEPHHKVLENDSILDTNVSRDRLKLEQLRLILERKSMDLSTKVQIRPLTILDVVQPSSSSLLPDHRELDVSGTEEPDDIVDFDEPSDEDTMDESRDHLTSPSMPTPPLSPPSQERCVTKAQIICKWGGEFTHSGETQSKQLGIDTRRYLTSLNEGVMDDIEVYSSPETRVTLTAEAFLRGLFRQNRPRPDGFSLQISKEMLDDSGAAKKIMDQVKIRLKRLMMSSENPRQLSLSPRAEFENPLAELQDLFTRISSVRDMLRENLRHDMLQTHSISTWCCGESPLLFRERWEKLYKSICDVERFDYDISKIPDLYDNLKYDALHCRDYLSCSLRNSGKDGDQRLRELFRKSQRLFNFVAPLEFGINHQEQWDIAQRTCRPLIHRLMTDLDDGAHRKDHPFARFYFTKESFVHTLFNFILLCGLDIHVRKDIIRELDYSTQIIFELYEVCYMKTAEDLRHGDDDGTNCATFSVSQANEHSIHWYQHCCGQSKYWVRLCLSPGTHCDDPLDQNLDATHALPMLPCVSLTDYLPLEKVLAAMENLELPGESRESPQIKLEKILMRETASPKHGESI